MGKRQVPTHWDRIRRRLSTVQNWAMLDYTEKEIAAKLNISLATFKRYKTDHPELAQALEKGAEDTNAAVVLSLLDKATGFTKLINKQTKLKRVEYDNGKKVREYEEMVPYIEEEYFAPETSAQQYWLNNRDAQKWKNKQEVDVGNTDTKPFHVVFEGELGKWSR